MRLCLYAANRDYSLSDLDDRPSYLLTDRAAYIEAHLVLEVVRRWGALRAPGTLSRLIPQGVQGFFVFYPIWLV